MGSIGDFAAVNTKIKVLERDFLNHNQLEKLVESRDYKDAILFLREYTSYSKILKEFSIDKLHRGELEIILKKNYIYKYCKLIHYLKGEYKLLFKILYMRFEIEDLKVILRGKFIGKSSDEIKKLMCYSSTLSSFDYNNVIEAKNLESAVEKLSETKYYKHIAHIAKHINEDGMFRLEMALDFVYFIYLRKFIKKLGYEDRECVEKFKGIQADLLNIQWIFRGKKYYKLPPEELLNYTIYDGHKLNKDKLKGLCYSKSIEEFYDAVQALPYGKLFSNSRYEEYLLEREILLYHKHIFEKEKRENKLNISAVISYLELALIEIRDVISIVENKRYSSVNDITLKYITVTI